MTTRRSVLSNSLLATLTLFVLYIGGCSDPSSSGSDHLPSFPYPDGGSSAEDAPWISKVDKPSADFAARVDTATPDVQSAPDRALLDVPFSRDGGMACAVSCDDRNPCTVDSCDPSTGLCVNTTADEGSACENACLAGGQGRCTLGVCKGAPAADGTPCSDSDPCTTGDSCKNGLCFSGPTISCPAIDICHEAGHCEPATGICTTPLATDGKFCDDGQACTTGDQCELGKCLGTSLTCSAGASCDPTGTCINDSGQPAFPSATLAVKLPNTTLSAVPALARDGEGSLFVVGTLLAPTDFGAGLLSPAGDQGDASTKLASDLLVAKIDPSTGLAVWSQVFGDRQDQTGNSLAVNRQGQLALTGQFVGSLVFGGNTITNPNAAQMEAFVAAVDASTGAGLWALRPQIMGSSLAVAADPITSDFLLCGTVTKLPAAGLLPTAGNPDGADIVVARLDAKTGAPVWGRQISAPGDQTCRSIAMDASGRVVVAGELTSLASGVDAGSAALDLGSGVEIALPGRPSGGTAQVIWMALLDAGTGNAIQGTSFAAPKGGRQAVEQVVCDQAGNIVVVGGMTGLAVVGPNTLTTAGGQDALAVQLDSHLVPRWSRQWGSADAELATAVAIGPADTLLLTGTYSHSLDLDGIALPLGAARGVSAFLARVDASTGTIISARGYGAAEAKQTSYGVVAAGAGQAAWLAGTFAGLLQTGPSAAILSNGGDDIGFLAEIAP